jgi:hypothetical protein
VEPTQYDVRIAHSYYQYFIDYFASIDQNSNLDEVVDNLIWLRQSVLNQGLECPSLKDLCYKLIKYLHGERVNVESPQILEFIDHVAIRELELADSYQRPQIDLVKHHKKDKKKHKQEKELKMGSKGVFGFIKALAGGLMCLIPGVQPIGVGLIIYGLNEIVDDAREQGDHIERDQKQREQPRKWEEEMFKEPRLP